MNETPITDAAESKYEKDGVAMSLIRLARDLEKDKAELIDVLDYWLNEETKSHQRFIEDKAMLARMKERK